MKKKKVKKIVIASVLCVAIIVTVCIIAFKPEEKLLVETVTVANDTIYETLDTSGSVSAEKTESFALPSGVKVISLNVKEGDIVEAGDVIATFDLSSMNTALLQKKSTYTKANAAYTEAVNNVSQLKSKIVEVKKQIAELEAEIERLSASAGATSKTQKTEPGVTVSEELVNRFTNVAKIFGVKYTFEEAESILIGFLSSGSNSNDVSSFVDNLGILSGLGGSFDMSALNGMTASSELMSAEMSLVQLKAQLATLELQSDSSYISTLKSISDQAYTAYIQAQEQINSMKNGWIAEKKGIVSKVNLNEDGTFKTGESSTQVDISTILTAVSSGADVTSMLGSLLGQGQTAIQVIYYPLVIDITLSKYDVLDVSINQSVIIESANGNEINGKVSYISAVATSTGGINIGSIMGGSTSSNVIPARITVDNSNFNLIVGTDVPVSIVTDTVENAIVVPVEAICIDGEDIFVYVLEDGKAVKRNVELGISSDTHYQIISGVSVNDVLIKNTLGLADGVSVETK